MHSENTVTFDTMSEADLDPVLEILQGKDPDAVARKAGITKQRLFRTRDDLLARIDRERTRVTDPPPGKTGRNAQCPCGSGKKFKHCCLDPTSAVRTAEQSVGSDHRQAREAAQAKLIQRIEKAFGFLRSGRYVEAIERASTLLTRYPNEDRLHDILAAGYLSAGKYETAIGICRQRLAVAESEKSFFIEHGRYRDFEIDTPALAYFYPPLTWLQKTWIAMKSRDYASRYPSEANAAIIELVSSLKTADDGARFPTNQTQGLDLRRNALAQTLKQLKAAGTEAIPYFLPLACEYSWAGIFVPEILSADPGHAATRALIDISMFGYAYASGASLHYLEKRKDHAVPAIQAAFSRDRDFDPIKTGIVSVLGNIRTPGAYELLLDLVTHNSRHIVNWAGEALGKHGNAAALPAMTAASERIGGEAMIDAAIDHLKGRMNPLRKRGRR